MQPIDKQIDDDERTMALVEQALERPAGERRRFLEDACSTDSALLESAWKYVQQEERLGDFLLEPLIGPAPIVKQTLHYEIVGVLGEGGQAKVYKAWDKNLKRHVALKFLPPYLRNGGMERERFFREAISVSALDNPNIATVHAIEETSDGVFIVMPCYEGENLRERIGKGPLAQAEAIGLAAQIARGLAAAHAAGVVHRDLKPSNVIITTQGVVKIIDFGIAKVDGNLRLTERGMRIGTTSYMSPEQAMGEPIDHRSDLWSLGVVLFEMLTGHAPFRGENAQKIVHGILHDPAPLMPAVAPAIQVVAQKLLAKQAADRYPGADDVIKALEAAQLQPMSSTVTIKPEPARGWTWTRRKAWTSIGMAGVLAAGFGIQQWSGHTTATPVKQVAVLPFRNIGGDTAQQALIDGLTETLTTALMRQPGLSVIAPSDSRKFETAAEARREFGVQLVIAGSVQRRGDNMRIVLGLIDAETQRQLDAQPIEWPVAQLPSLEDGVVAKLGDMLSVAIPPQQRELLRISTSQSASAHEAYLRGRGLLYRYDVAGNVERARASFEEAVQRDPDFAAAYVGEVEALRVIYHNRHEANLLEAAGRAANRAVSLTPRFADGHRALGAVLVEKADFIEAERELETALKLDPLDPVTYRELASLYQTQRKFSQAEAVLQRAVAARPGDWINHNELGVFYRSQQRYADAERSYRQVVELAPDNYMGYRNLGVALFSLGRTRQAESMLRKAIALHPHASAYNNLGAVLMFEKRYSDAVPVMEKAAEFAPSEMASSFRLWGNLGDAYWLAHADPQKARAAWIRAAETVEQLLIGSAGDAERLSFLANYRAKAGAPEEAVRRIESAIAYAPESATVRYQAALTYTVLGMKERALEELRLAASHGYSMNEIRTAPELEPLRPDPKYPGLFEKNSGR